MDWRVDSPIAPTGGGILAALASHYGRGLLKDMPPDQPIDHSSDADLARLLGLKGTPQSPSQGIGLGMGDPGLRRPYDYQQQAQSQQGWRPL